MTTKTRTAEEMLRDMAFAMRMARKISNEIRHEARQTSEPKRVPLTDAGRSVTLAG